MYDIKEAVQYIEVRCLKNYSFQLGIKAGIGVLKDHLHAL